ncbi:MAG TPA: hypothetical protein VN648_21270 [Candidatus Methylomirabilis sp.]|nr:hypothetical protein [Candidatus Methylomirabilis sp.]
MKRATFPKLIVTALSFAAIGYVPTAGHLAAQAGSGRAPRDRGFAAIVDSGSTNTSGFRILVEPSGRTQSIVVPRVPQGPPVELPITTIGRIPSALARRLYSDLDIAWPLSSLPPTHCLKSASFGTRLTIEFADQTTPDLSCGNITDPSLRALARDAREIVAAPGAKRAGRD